MSTLLTVDEYESDSYMGSTGTKPANAVQVAIDIAEGRISEALGFQMEDDGTPTFIQAQFTEEHKWPIPNRPLLLNVPRIISLDEVLALHDLGTCDCEWTELTACGFVHDARVGIVKFRTCERASSCWIYCGCPNRIRVTYTAGWMAAEVGSTTPTGMRLRLAIALEARAVMDLQDHYTDGGVAVSSYSSLDYSEKREFERSALGRKMGLSMLSQAAADLLRPLIVKRGGAAIARSQ